MNEAKTNDEMALGEREAAKKIGVSVASMRKWRFERRGPNYCKIGRRVVYLIDDLSAYLKSKRVVME